MCYGDFSATLVEKNLHELAIKQYHPHLESRLDSFLIDVLHSNSNKRC
jgi:hypothetical protein